MLSNLLIVILLNSSIHTLGHVEQGRRLGVDVEVNISQLSEAWYTNKLDNRLLITGAGFRAQDAFVRFTNDTNLHKPNLLYNGIYKLGYLVNFHHVWNDDRGDVEDLQIWSENKIIKPIIFVAALSDIYKFYDPSSNLDLNFWQSKNGAPGMIATINF